MTIVRRPVLTICSLRALCGLFSPICLVNLVYRFSFQDLTWRSLTNRFRSPASTIVTCHFLCYVFSIVGPSTMTINRRCPFVFAEPIYTIVIPSFHNGPIIIIVGRLLFTYPFRQAFGRSFLLTLFGDRYNAWDDSVQSSREPDRWSFVFQRSL